MVVAELLGQDIAAHAQVKVDKIANRRETIEILLWQLFIEFMAASLYSFVDGF